MSSLSKFSQLEISRLFAGAKRVLRHQSLDILLSPTLSGPLGRILVVTPRRIGNAPQRNKVRRRLKALYYETELFKKGYDCAVIVKRDGVDLSFEELKMLLNQAFISPYVPIKKNDQ